MGRFCSALRVNVAVSRLIMAVMTFTVPSGAHTVFVQGFLTLIL
jgi:hypothetical protein